MAKYLVAGGCGYIGSSLCCSLLKQGHQVKVVDIKSPIYCIPGVIYHQADLCNFSEIQGVFEDIDGCFYMAFENNFYINENRLVMAHTRSLLSFLNVLNLCAIRKKIVPLVFLSSESVYGNSIDHRLSENSCLNPICAKGLDYFVMENHARRVSLLHDVPCTGLRVFNLYGSWVPGWNNDEVSSCCQKVLSGGAVDVDGNGQQSWDFIHISDVVTAISTAMQVAYKGYNIYNLCTGESSSINDIINILGMLSGKLVNINYGNPNYQDCLNRVGDNSRIRCDLNFYHRYSLVEGIRQILGSAGEISIPGKNMVYR